MNKICLTFDVEEWRLPEHCNVFHKENASTSYSKKGMDLLLDLFEKKKIKATFFVTGYFARSEPDTVKQIVKKGHELGSHGDVDVPYYKISKEQATKNIIDVTKTLKKFTKKPMGFRAPLFSMTPHVLKQVIKAGYAYDSSTHPAILPGHYIDFSPLTPHKRYVGKLSIQEIPVAVIPIVRQPISWWWFRNIGYWYTKWGTQINLRSRNVNLYFHPWEFVTLPKVKGIPNHMTKKTGKVNLIKLEKFIDYFKNKGVKFTTCINQLA